MQREESNNFFYEHILLNGFLIRYIYIWKTEMPISLEMKQYIVLIDATSMREYWEHARESMSYRFL